MQLARKGRWLFAWLGMAVAVGLIAWAGPAQSAGPQSLECPAGDQVLSAIYEYEPRGNRAATPEAALTALINRDFPGLSAYGFSRRAEMTDTVVLGSDGSRANQALANVDRSNEGWVTSEVVMCNSLLKDLRRNQ